MEQLPAAAQAMVDRILTFLDEAQRLGLDRVSGSEDSYALRMTRERYLRDALDAYARIPVSMRQTPDPATGKNADDLLLEQLQILERATAQRLSRTSQSAHSDLAAHGRFLSERLGSAESLPEAPAIEAQTQALPPSLHFVESLTARARNNKDLLNGVAAKLYAAFPLLTEVDRGLFGTGPARRAAITVPLGNDRLRYAVGLGPSGEIETTCSKIVRGVTIRTEQVPFEEWARALYDDLSTYARTSVQAQEMLGRLLG